MAKQTEEQRKENLEAGGKVCGIEGKDGEACEWVIHPEWEQKAAKGFIYFTDSRVSSQPFAHRHNLTFRATGKAKTPKSSNGLSDALEKLILDPANEEAQLEAKRLLARAVGDLAQGNKGAASVQALQIGANLAGEFMRAVKPPAEHQRCKVCGREAQAEQMVVDKETAILLYERGRFGPIEDLDGDDLVIGETG